MKNTLPTENYKGVRDFYPNDMYIQEYIFSVWKSVAEQFGYQEYSASLLEPTELYRSKTSSEIVNEQTYSFVDRGDREVTLRPEMTPTIARMVAGKRREIGLPVRWYSIPNVFRYERPQRGRLREHWQLNADCFGLAGTDIEIEMLTFASTILTTFGLEPKDFTIHINDRSLVDAYLTEEGFDEEKITEMKRLIDKKNKIENFDEKLTEVAGRPFVFKLDTSETITTLIATLKKLGIKNVVFDSFLMRGFDYYTGIVFEVFDNHPDNARSLFGGGRYDNLTELFGEKDIPAIGFGMGDVTIKDVLETYNLIPEYMYPATLALCPISSSAMEQAHVIAQKLREQGIPTLVDFTNKKAGDKLAQASKKGIPFAITLGDDELEKDVYIIKELASHSENKARGLKGILKYFS